MKRCPVCEFIYEDDQSLCDIDGVELVCDRGASLALAKAAVQRTLEGARAQYREFSFLVLVVVLLAAAAFSTHLIQVGGTPPVDTAHSSPPGMGNTVGASTPSAAPDTSREGPADGAPDSGAVNTSDWVSGMSHGYQKITIRNNSKQKYVRVTDLLVYDCRNVAPYFCGTRTLNLVLPPGGASDVYTLGPSDATSAGGAMSFEYKYWAELAEDLNPKQRGRRGRGSK